MEPLYQYAWLIPVLPLVGGAIVGTGLITFSQTTNSNRAICAGTIVSLMGASMVLSFALLWSQIQGHEAYTRSIEWATAGNFHLTMGYVVDHLSALMMVIVCTVAFLVMIYTDGYMAHDPGYVRFYTYLSLFGSSMLGLVVSPNLVEVYIFWELVGMCSYLLVGYWYERKAAAEACQKAFVVNRVGDFGLLLGILGLFWATGSFDFVPIGERLQELSASGSISAFLVAFLAILVFLGPVAKSAQVPLHVWLPDAMEGPTPISALIHAATMVAAGVFLVARMYPVFEPISSAMTIIAWTGAVTAFVGATIAPTQMDLKKSMAYSTMSQLGYMVMAMGIGAYSAGLFHLMTHAYFKAMLFLCCGSAIHGMEHVVGHDPALNQDMRLMGGLRKFMPITAITFLIGVLAISGIPPFAGFWSKDEILGAAFAANPALWVVGWLTAALTAFYMFRMYLMAFEGEFKGNDMSVREKLMVAAGIQPEPQPAFGPGAMDVKELDAEGSDPHGHEEHSEFPHESPVSMTLPLIALAIPATVLGFVGMPWSNFFEAFINAPGEVVTVAQTAAEFDKNEFILMAGSSVAIATVGSIVAFMTYLWGKIDPAEMAAKYPTIYKLSLNKWYFDDIYNRVFVQGSRRLARQIMEVDYRVVDGVVNLTGLATLISGEGLKYFENGRAQFYALIVFAAVLILAIVFTVT
ncbi:MAG: NAD(P)H-quinone oxidoreductase subunit 5 [Prochloraceae cyanobacterium]|nr:NAD(P)H-quinone oxidoreductase subunit 5 [Prochloraceae cyanobacterium]